MIVPLFLKTKGTHQKTTFSTKLEYVTYIVWGQVKRKAPSFQEMTLIFTEHYDKTQQ